jgi:hypothetical protein
MQLRVDGSCSLQNSQLLKSDNNVRCRVGMQLCFTKQP